MLHFYGYGLWSWLLTTLQHLRPFAIPDLRLVAATLSRPQGHGTWPFQGSGATAPEYYKLRNFTYRSSSSYNIDDATRILLLYTCRQPQLPHSPTSTSWSSWGWWLPSPDVPPGHGGRLRAAATAPSTCQVPIVHTGSLLYVYHSAEERWCCCYYILQDYSTHTPWKSCFWYWAGNTGRLGPSTLVHTPRSRRELWWFPTPWCWGWSGL